MEPHTDFDWSAIDAADAGGAPKPTLTEADFYEAMRRIARYLRTKPRARLSLDCLMLALGDSEAESMRAIAEHYGLTPALISDRTKEIRAQLNLAINANNKSAGAVEKYRNNRSTLRLDRPA